MITKISPDFRTDSKGSNNPAYADSLVRSAGKEYANFRASEFQGLPFGPNYKKNYSTCNFFAHKKLINFPLNTHAYFVFVWFDSLPPIVKQGRVFLGWTSTKLG